MARILVIDDERNIQNNIRVALTHVGHTIEVASDGLEGLQKFDEGRDWDLVLLDQRMEGLDGLTVLKEMRHRDPATRVIMITAFGTIDLAVEAMKAGATDFLRKPFTSDTLRGAVKAALDGFGGYVPGAPPVQGPTYGHTLLNGFRIEYHPGPGTKTGGDITHAFTVRNPDGQARECRVIIPVYVIELIKAHADLEQMPGGDRFWQGLAEDIMANYLWQNATFPDDPIRIEGLENSIQRWIDSVLSNR